jgi:hypothetical protein
MEERLALYRKKYGKRLDQAPAAAGPRGGGKTDPRRKGHRAPQGPGQQAESAEAATRKPEARPETMPGRQEPEPSAPAGGEKPRGIFGKLQDLFGAHKE